MTPIILASASTSRQSLLTAAGVTFEVMASRVDESAVKACGGAPRDIAETLASLKALAVPAQQDCLVIGADQTLELDGELIDKAPTPQEARTVLARLRGRSHNLHAAVAVARDGVVIWSMTDTVCLTMRHISDPFLDAYAARHGKALTWSCGAYFLEGEGVQLFERVEGDYFSVLGLPLLPLLGFLREAGALAS